MNEPELFRLYAAVAMNRTVDPEKDIISPGGYEMVFGGRKIRFDFQQSEWNCKDDCVFYMQKNPDYLFFPKAAALGKKELSELTEIIDFYIDTDTKDGAEPLKPVKLLAACFEVDGTEIPIPEHLCKEVFK